MDMGTGKTITTIALVGTMYHKHKILNLLVVSPKSITGVWDQEFEKFANFPYSLAVLDGTGTQKADTIRHMIGHGLQVIVVNYPLSSSALILSVMSFCRRCPPNWLIKRRSSL